VRRELRCAHAQFHLHLKYLATGPKILLAHLPAHHQTLQRLQQYGDLQGLQNHNLPPTGILDREINKGVRKSAYRGVHRGS
jgi:hypothetical protein